MDQPLGTSGAIYDFGEFRLDTVQRRLFRSGSPVTLPAKAFDTLIVLVENYGRTVGKDELMERVWPDVVVEENNLGQYISLLRKAMGESRGEARLIMTVSGTGYRFVTPVRRVAEPHTLAHAPTPEALPNPDLGASFRDQLLPGSPSQTSEAKSRRILSAAYIWSAGVFVLLAALASAMYRAHTLAGPPPKPSAPLVRIRPSFAVLGLQNLSQRSHDQWLSTALAESLTTELGSRGSLRAIPGESVSRAETELRLRRTDGLAQDTLAKLRQDIGADFVITGAYTVEANSHGPADDGIRVDLQVQNALTGEIITSFAEKGHGYNLFELVARIGTRMRESLGVDASPPLRTEPYLSQTALPSDSASARLYSEGLAKLRTLDARRARDLLQSAIARDPSFPLAHAALARAWAILGYNENALGEAKTAFELSANLSREERLLVEGEFRAASGDWEKAVAAYSDLFVRYPDSADYGLRLAEAQRLGAHAQDALATIASLSGLPAPIGTDPRIPLEESRARHFLSDEKRAQSAAYQAELQAQSAGSRLLQAQALEASSESLSSSGSYAQARDAADQARRICEDMADSLCLAKAYLDLGTSESFLDPAVATEDRRKAYELASREGLEGFAATALNDLASVLFYGGELEEADKDYRESSEIFLKTNDKVGLIKATINRGNISYRAGRLRDADIRYRKAAELAGSCGQRSLLMLSLNNLGNAEQLEGELPAAMKHYQQSLQLTKEIGIDPGMPLANIGDLLYVEGDLAAAMNTLQETIAPKQAGVRGYFGYAEIDLAALKIDRGDAASAENQARQIAADAAKQKDMDMEARAIEAVARAQLIQGKLDEARQSIERAKQLQDTRYMDDARLTVAITEAQIKSASAHYSPSAVNDSLHQLRGLVRTAEEQGDVSMRFDALLAEAEIELHAGEASNARQGLKVLKHEAQRKSFGLIAQRADALLRANQPPSP